MLKKALLFLIPMLLVVACGDDSSNNEKASTDADVIIDIDNSEENEKSDEDKKPSENLIDPIKRDLSWKSCSLFEGENDGRAECATVEMPLFRRKESKETINIFAKRLKAKGEAKAQLWFIDGGPGGAGSYSNPSYMEQMQKAYPELDVYTIDHRGCGYSEYLSCENGNPYSDACIAELKEKMGDRLHGFSTTESAADLADFIESTREGGKKVFVWGGSYGTYLVQRYLLLFPEQADGTIIEGIAPIDSTFISFDEYADKVVKRLLDLCGKDEICSTKLGSEPIDFTRKLFSKIEKGHCSAELGYSLNSQDVSGMIVQMMYSTQINWLVPSVLYRLDRCEQKDTEALSNLINIIFGGGMKRMGESRDMSDVLYANVVLSEMWTHPDFDLDNLFDYFTELEDKIDFYTGPGMLQMNGFYNKWNRYSEPLDNVWADTETPVLMLEGRLDPATTLEMASRLKDHYTADAHYFLEFPFAAHNVVSGAPMKDGKDCAEKIFVDFLKNPEQIDTSCMKNLQAIDFNGNSEIAKVVYGTSDIFENTAAAFRSNADISDYPELQKAIEDIRKRIAAQPEGEVSSRFKF